MPSIAKKKRGPRSIKPRRIRIVAEIYSALHPIDPDIEYNDWIKVGMAIHQVSGGSKEGLRLWGQWSIKGKTFRKGECTYRWNTFGDGGVTINSLFQIAHQHGWKGDYLNDKLGRKYARIEYKRRLKHFSDRHGIVMIEGKVAVIYRQIDENVGHWDTRFTTLPHLETLYENRVLPAVVVGKGSEQPMIRLVSLVETWQRQKGRKQYAQVVFKPKAGLIAGNDILPVGKYYNLYQGLATKPVEGDCWLIRKHIGEIWCGGNKVLYVYVINWLARMFQHPGEQGHTALVLRSGEGTGKGIITDMLVEAFGTHSYIATSTKEITGQFNDHLATAVLVVANEAVWGGDKSQEGVLKSLITDPHQFFEKKYLPKFQVRNCCHLLMLTNNDWVAPVGLDDRRYLYLDVSEKMKGNHDYFNKLVEQIEGDGAAAFIHFLLNRDISGFNPRVMPEVANETKLDNQIRTAGSIVQWWYYCLIDDR